MFSAQRCDGAQISLINKTWSREELERERIHFNFHCPKCKEKLILKLGAYQAWHFAHHRNSSCSSSNKGETKEHLQGKWLLLKWLQSHGYGPQEEYYIKEIKQRPDIFVRIEGKDYVFELQRSALSEKQFGKRQQLYEQYGITAVWVGFTNPNVNHDRLEFPCRFLDNLLIRTNPKQHSIYLNIANEEWLVLSEFLYYSPKKLFVRANTLPLVHPPGDLLYLRNLTPKASSSYYYEMFFKKWYKETKTKRLKRYLSLTSTERKILKLFQVFHLNLNYFPALASLPLKTNINFITSPQWWQSWLILNVINKKPVNHLLRVSETSDALYKAVTEGIIIVRPLGLHHKLLIRDAILEYLSCLSLFDVVEKTYPGVYKIKNHININKQLDTLCMDDVFVLQKFKEEWENENIFRI